MKEEKEDNKLAEDIALHLWGNSKLRHGLFNPAMFKSIVSAGIKQYFLEQRQKRKKS